MLKTLNKLTAVVLYLNKKISEFSTRLFFYLTYDLAHNKV